MVISKQVKNQQSNHGREPIKRLKQKTQINGRYTSQVNQQMIGSLLSLNLRTKNKTKNSHYWLTRTHWENYHARSRNRPRSVLSRQTISRKTKIYANKH